MRFRRTYAAFGSLCGTDFVLVKFLFSLAYFLSGSSVYYFDLVQKQTSSFHLLFAFISGIRYISYLYVGPAQ